MFRTRLEQAQNRVAEERHKCKRDELMPGDPVRVRDFGNATRSLERIIVECVTGQDSVSRSYLV